jgi:hypothetical protein
MTCCLLLLATRVTLRPVRMEIPKERAVKARHISTAA